MERIMSVEEKIRRAEEIYARRQEGSQRKTATVTINNNNKKDIKLLKKMIIQIIISLIIYFIFYIIQNNNYIFSEDFLNKANEILSYDINFMQIYENLKQNINNIKSNYEEDQNNNQEVLIENNVENIENNTESNIENNIEANIENAIGGAEKIAEDNVNETIETNIEENKEQKVEESNTQNVQELTQEEKDIANIKATTTFIKPVEGTVSSRFGQREPTTSTVPKNHTGIDIAANTGTKIKSATSGEVVLASEQGDYGKHLKIQIGEVSLIYAHCNKLYVKQGDIITQGQEIAEVGSTGNSTGPHLHFEIRISERVINPESILQF